MASAEYIASISQSTRGAKSLTGPSIVKTPALFEYQLQYGLRETEHQVALRHTIEESKFGHLASSPDESEFIALLADLTGAKNVIGIQINRSNL
jgi:hypothetical protein